METDTEMLIKDNWKNLIYSVDRKITRTAISLAQKVEILEKLGDPIVKRKDIAIEYGLSVSTISKLLKNRDDIMHEWHRGANQDRKRKRLGKVQSVDEALLRWFAIAKEKETVITGPILMAKAKSLAETLGVEFNPSQGWLQRWKDRNNIVIKRVHAEKSQTDGNMSDWPPTLLPTILSRFTPEQRHTWLQHAVEARNCKEESDEDSTSTAPILPSVLSGLSPEKKQAWLKNVKESSEVVEEMGKAGENCASGRSPDQQTNLPAVLGLLSPELLQNCLQSWLARKVVKGSRKEQCDLDVFSTEQCTHAIMPFILSGLSPEEQESWHRHLREKHRTQDGRSASQPPETSLTSRSEEQQAVLQRNSNPLQDGEGSESKARLCRYSTEQQQVWIQQLKERNSPAGKSDLDGSPDTVPQDTDEEELEPPASEAEVSYCLRRIHSFLKQREADHLGHFHTFESYLQTLMTTDCKIKGKC
ncbi:uncharacterized protein LOC121328321 [Polyodon spathula]|uniref:uncharacterized protein LOC121328321 n=1 Tax=Polyodon spathula TaxID=7913 RepID=UPI001B7F6528|nr:uncharacterized protein LOC121328321 [Polyodon spathula]